MRNPSGTGHRPHLVPREGRSIAVVIGGGRRVRAGEYGLAVSRVAAIAVGLALLCPAASAAVRERLDLMPLPRGALGPGTSGLRLARDSGVVSNAYAADSAGNGYTAADLAKLGRVTGYTLDYLLPDPAGSQPHELLRVQTDAELYRDRATATRGLAFWRGLTRRLAGRQNGATVAVSPFGAHVGDGSFAFELTYRTAGPPFAYVGDVVFRLGRLVGAVFVTATDDSELRARTLQLADKLAIRMRRVLAGQIRH
jgi:hypothetical protein